MFILPHCKADINKDGQESYMTVSSTVWYDCDEQNRI